MNRHRDIDQVLDAWFVDGPSHMPDHLFEAVLDGVERQPQRRRPWATLRVRPMSLQLRLAAAAAIVVLIGGAGFALLNRPSSNQNVGNTPAPSSSSSAAADAAVPVELRNEFTGPLRTVPVLGPDRTILVMAANSFEVAMGNSTQLRSRASAPGPGQIRLVTLVAASGCQEGDEGIYTYSFSPGGSILTIEPAPDDCETRAQTVPGEWQRSACQNDSNLCLGSLEAGSYSSLFIDPYIPYNQPWKARFGALTYTVPDGWENTHDFPTTYGLRPQGTTDGSGIYVYSDVVIMLADVACSEVPDPAVGRTADAISYHLWGGVDGVDETDRVETTIGGLSGWTIDLSMRGSWRNSCPFIEDQAAFIPLFTDPDPAEGGLSHGLVRDSRMRVYALDLGDGRALVIVIEGHGEAASQALIEEATTIVESMEFPR